MQWFSSTLALIAITVVGRAVDATPVGVTGSNAQGWLWVAPDRQQLLVADLREYARRTGLHFSSRKLPGPPWDMTEVTLVTPKGNSVTVANATARDKFSVAITLFHPEDNWRVYWDGLRKHLSARYKWEDVQ
jgi:hypothetical protein